METYIITALIGTLEGLLIDRAGGTGRKIIFNHFSWYHVFLLITIGITMYLHDVTWPHVFLLLLVQDVTSHLSSITYPQPQDWINWPFYYMIFGIIPIPYLLLVLAFFLAGRL